MMRASSLSSALKRQSCQRPWAGFSKRQLLPGEALHESDTMTSGYVNIKVFKFARSRPSRLRIPAPVVAQSSDQSIGRSEITAARFGSLGQA